MRDGQQRSAGLHRVETAQGPARQRGRVDDHIGPFAQRSEQVALLNTEVNAILRDPEVRDNLVKQGLNPLPGAPEDLARMIDTDLERWTRIIRAAKIKAD